MKETASVDYSKCWANPLGDCAGGMTAEHVISKNQFNTTGIVVQGYPWCRDAPKTVGLASLVANILCKRHNNALSPLDDSAATLLTGLTLLGERTLLAARRAPPQPVRVFRISGDEFERWMLKTTINLALQQGSHGSGGMFESTGKPARRYVEIAFGRAAFGPGEGLRWVAVVGEQVAVSNLNSIQFQSWLRAEDQALIGASMLFHGHRLWIALDGAPEVEHVLFPPRGINGSDLNVRIDFEWSKDRERQFSKARAAGR